MFVYTFVSLIFFQHIFYYVSSIAHFREDFLVNVKITFQVAPLVSSTSIFGTTIESERERERDSIESFRDRYELEKQISLAFWPSQEPLHSRLVPTWKDLIDYSSKNIARRKNGRYTTVFISFLLSRCLITIKWRLTRFSKCNILIIREREHLKGVLVMSKLM